MRKGVTPARKVRSRRLEHFHWPESGVVRSQYSPPKHTEGTSLKTLFCFVALKPIQVDTSEGHESRAAVATTGDNASDGAATGTNVDPLQTKKVRSSNEHDKTMATSTASSSPTADSAPEGSKAKPKKGKSKHRSATKKIADDTTSDRDAAANSNVSKEEEREAAKSPTASSSKTDDPASEREKLPRKASKRRSKADRGEDGASADVVAAADVDTSKREKDETAKSPAASVLTGGSLIGGNDKKTGKSNNQSASVESAGDGANLGGAAAIGASISKEQGDSTATSAASARADDPDAAATAAHLNDPPSNRKGKKPRKSRRRDSPADQVADGTTAMDGAAAAAVGNSKGEKEEAEVKTPAVALHAAGSPSDRIKAKPTQADTSPRSPAEQAATGTVVIGTIAGAEPSTEDMLETVKSPGAIVDTGDPTSERKDTTRKANKRPPPATKETEGTTSTGDEATAVGVGASKQGGEEENAMASPAASATRDPVAPPPGRNEKLREVKQTRFDKKTTGTKPTAATGREVHGSGASKERQEGTAKTPSAQGAGVSSVFDRKTMTRKAKTPSNIVWRKARRALADSVVSRPPARRPENPARKLGRRNSGQNVEGRPAIAAPTNENRDFTAEKGEGANNAGAAGVTPTPPKKGSNPINSVTPPRSGSRGGNLAVSSSCSSVGERRVSSFHSHILHSRQRLRRS